MKELKIKESMLSKIIQKGSIIIRVADLKPRQYAQVYKLGFIEIFEDEKGNKQSSTSDKEAERTTGTDEPVGGVQRVEQKAVKTRASGKSKNR